MYILFASREHSSGGYPYLTNNLGSTIKSGTGPGYIYTSSATNIFLNTAFYKQFQAITSFYVPASVPWTTDVDVLWCPLA
jgi:hypothetical protein